MANALQGKTLTTLTVILPNEEVAAEMMENIHGHLEFMQEKSYREGPFKLIQYFISSGPEWKESSSFLDGKMPEKTGRVVVTLVEIYETDDGLYHHWIESKEHHQILEDLLKEVGGEIQTHSFQKIIQSLWD
jgi:hypothetical protein